MTATGKVTRYPRSFGMAWRDGLAGLPVVVGLSGSLGELERSPDEAVSASFEIIRIGDSFTACSVDWRVEGVGADPVLPVHFAGGVMPEGIAAFGSTDTIVPATIILSAGAPPPARLNGRVMLFDPDGCQIAEGHAELLFSIAAEVITDEAAVALSVPFTAIAPGVNAFSITRSGDLAVPCSVAWVMQGTGANPVPAASFAGGVLPSGTASFAAAETSQPASFDLTATTAPLLTQTGRLLLQTPVDCKIDPGGESYAVSIPGGEVPAEEWEFTAANMAVHPAPGQAGRVTFSEGQVEVAGAANADDLNVALWFKALPFQNYEVVFEYEKNEDAPAVDAGGRFVQFWGAMLGTTSKPADVTTWTEAQWGVAGDEDYGDYSKSWRITHDNESTDAENSNEARLGIYNEGVITRPDPTPGPNFWFAGATTKYRLSIRREGEVVTITKAPAEPEAAIQWTAPGAAYPGRIGWRFGRGRGGILRQVEGVPFIRNLGGGQTSDFPFGPWRVWQRATGTGPGISRPTTGDQLRAAIANAQSGDQILLPAGGNINLSGDLIINRAVSGEDAYYIATDTDSDDPASFCRLSGGNIIHRGAYRCVMNGIRQIGNYMRPEDATLCQWERFWVSGIENDNRESGPSYREPAWFEVHDNEVEKCLLGFVHYDACGASFYDQQASGDNARNPSRLLLTHLDIDQAGPVSKFMQPGRNDRHGLVSADSRVQYCLDRRSRREGSVSGSSIDWIEMKTNGWYFYSNTIEDDALVKIRHGRLGASGDGGRGPKYGNTFESNLWIAPDVELSNRGAYHEWKNNWCVQGLGSTGRPTLDSRVGNGKITIHVGRSDGQYHPPTTASSGTSKECGTRMSGYGIRAGGNRGFRVYPQRDSSCQPTIKPKDCIVTRTGQGRNSSVPDDSDWGAGTDFTTRLDGADIDKIPRRMFTSEVGPRAWRAQFAAVYRP